MTGAEWIGASLLLGLLCGIAAAWYRRAVDGREAKYGWVCKSGALR